MSDRDIVERLRAAVTASGGIDLCAPGLLIEAADCIEFLRRQSRGHFEAMTAVLRDGVKALDLETPSKKPN